MKEIQELELFISFLERKTGITFGEYQYSFLDKILCSRIKALSLYTVSEYIAFLCKDSFEACIEWQDLIQSITIRQTGWFRNKEDFYIFSHFLVPQILQKKDYLNILSMGCSTGEEAYSLLFSILESPYFLSSNKFFLMATDISGQSIEFAKKGCYKKENTESIPPAICQKYFISFSEESIQVKQEFRSKISFLIHNLQSSDYPKPPYGNWDVIFCRNVLIYFREEEKKKVLENFYHLLPWEGYLFLGYSESLFAVSSLFSLVFFDKSFCYKKVTSCQEQQDLFQDFSSLPNAKEKKLPIDKELKKEKEEMPCYSEIISMLQGQQKEKAKESLEKILSSHKDIPCLLTLGNLYYASYDFSRALGLYEQAIKENYLLAESYILAGIALYALSQCEMAISAFKKAAFLESEWIIPRFYLGILYEKKGIKNQAELYFQQVEKIYQKGLPQIVFLSYMEEMEDFLLSPAKLYKLLQKKLKKTKKLKRLTERFSL